MGMDVYARRPKHEGTKHFRANIWEWRAIHDYMSNHAGHLYPTNLDYQMSFNDGRGLNAAQSVTVAKALKEAIAKETNLVLYRLREPELVRALRLCESPYAVSSTRLSEWAQFVEESGGFQVF